MWHLINAVSVSSDLCVCFCVIRNSWAKCHSAASRCECITVKQSVPGNSACMFNISFQHREVGGLYRWIGNQSLCCSIEYKRPTTAYNYSTHRKQLFAFPARTSHSALVARARWRPLLWTVLVCSIFILANYREATSNTEPIEWSYEVIIDVSSEAALKQQWFKEMRLRNTPGGG